MARSWQAAGLLLAVFFLVSEGCLGVGSYQPADILPAGEKTVGIGVPLVLTGSYKPALGAILPEIYGRVGLGHRLDLGWRFPLFLFSPSSTGFLVNLNADLRYGPPIRFPRFRPLLVLRGDLLISSDHYLLVTAPMVAIGDHRTFMGGGPLLYFSDSDREHFPGLMGFRLEWTTEKPFFWGVVRPEFTVTLFTRDPEGRQADLWMVSTGVSAELSLNRLREQLRSSSGEANP